MRTSLSLLFLGTLLATAAVAGREPPFAHSAAEIMRGACCHHGGDTALVRCPPTDSGSPGSAPADLEAPGAAGEQGLPACGPRRAGRGAADSSALAAGQPIPAFILFHNFRS